jgi:hypothetical protein
MITGVLLLLGCVGVSVCGPVGFWLALISIMLIGAASALGESVVLGFLKLYPAALTGAWSSGTGMAGVGGSAFYLILSVAGLSNAAIFGIQAPFAVIYVAVFVWMVQRPIGISAAPRTRSTVSLDVASASDSGQTPLFAETKKQRYSRVFSLVVYYAVHLSLVYFFEYVVSGECTWLSADGALYEIGCWFLDPLACVWLAVHSWMCCTSQSLPFQGQSGQACVRHSVVLLPGEPWCGAVCVLVYRCLALTHWAWLLVV